MSWWCDRLCIHRTVILAMGRERSGAKRSYKHHDFLSFCGFGVGFVSVLPFVSFFGSVFLVEEWVLQAQVGLELERDRDVREISLKFPCDLAKEIDRPDKASNRMLFIR